MSGGVCTTSAGIAPRDLKANVVRLPPGVRPVVQQTNKSVGLALRRDLYRQTGPQSVEGEGNQLCRSHIYSV